MGLGTSNLLECGWIGDEVKRTSEKQARPKGSRERHVELLELKRAAVYRRMMTK